MPISGVWRLVSLGTAMGAGLLLRARLSEHTHPRALHPAGTDALHEARRAHDRFYAALNRVFMGDIAPMEVVWSHADDVTLLGPFAGRLEGWRQVREEFTRESSMRLGGRVEARDVVVRADEQIAYTLCVEHGKHFTVSGQPIRVEHRATNIFRREGGEWKMVHHHTDLAPELMRAVGLDV